MTEDRCEYCGSEELDLAYTSDGNVLLCLEHRARYEAELERERELEAKTRALNFKLTADEVASVLEREPTADELLAAAAL